MDGWKCICLIYIAFFFFQNTLQSSKQKQIKLYMTTQINNTKENVKCKTTSKF